MAKTGMSGTWRPGGLADLRRPTFLRGGCPKMSRNVPSQMGHLTDSCAPSPALVLVPTRSTARQYAALCDSPARRLLILAQPILPRRPAGLAASNEAELQGDAAEHFRPITRRSLPGQPQRRNCLGGSEIASGVKLPRGNCLGGHTLTACCPNRLFPLES